MQASTIIIYIYPYGYIANNLKERFMRKTINKIAEKIERFMELGGVTKEIILLCISGAAVILSLINRNFGFWNLPFDLAWVSVILCGAPIIIEAIIGLVTAFDIKADVLVSMAIVASLLIGEDFAAGEVAFIMQLGALLEDLTVAKARAGIEKLVRLTPQTARVVCGETERVIAAEEVKTGDIIRVLSGETVPVDGVIISGQTSINQAVMTGESLPVDKTVGDEVSSGTVNQFGVFEMRATKVGADSSIQRMISLVRSADANKAKIVGLADKWATWIVIIALSAAGLTWAISGEIIRAVTILVVFCPCALVLATPTAIMAAIGNATKHGFLVREGDALERLAKISKITFDKTGTLTYGNPEVIKVKSVAEGLSDDDLYRLVATAERLSEHPLGKAVVACARKTNINLGETKDFKTFLGEGVTAVVDGVEVAAGNAKLLKKIGVGVDESVGEQTEKYLSDGCTIIYAVVNGKLAGFVVLSDTIRKESASMLVRLKNLGVTPVLLTGDNANAAKSIGGKLGITEILPDCLPEDKLEYVSDCQKNGEKVCMIGDGINDAPALKKADVGIAMCGVGSDIAVDAADIALVDDEVKELPHLLALSKRMMKTIKLNMTFSMGLNFLAIALAISGILNPVVGALVHNAGSVLVIINSSLLLSWKSSKA